MVNLLGLLQNLESLSLWIGPNFAPEHLEEIFSRHMPRLRYLSLRFRPYVQKATYYQFLKGAYFDSTLLALSAWPPSSHGLPTLSIVQDPFIPDPSQMKQRFAQPIVFFRLDLSLSFLIHSPPSAASLKSLRIRIPARSIVLSLTTTYTTTKSDSNPTIPPSIELLDISTCSVLDSDVDKILLRFKNLKHLILDGCVNLLRGGAGPGLGQELDWWSALGRRCALAGVQKAREKEKEIKAWFEVQIRNNVSAEKQETNPTGLATDRRPRRGRKGLATATISLRDSTPSSTPGPSSAVRQNRLTAQINLGTPPKVQIVPPLPTLISISLHPTTLTNVITPEMRALVVTEFESGWRDGIRVLWERRGRLGASFLRSVPGTSKVKFLKFKEEYDEDETMGDFEGLEDVKPNDPDMFAEPINEDGSPRIIDAPVLCLGGVDHAEERHISGCGHSVAWGIWADQR